MEQSIVLLSLTVYIYIAVCPPKSHLPPTGPVGCRPGIRTMHKNNALNIRKKMFVQKHGFIFVLTF